MGLKPTLPCPVCATPFILTRRDKIFCGSSPCRRALALKRLPPCACGRPGVVIYNTGGIMATCQRCLDIEARNEQVRAAVKRRAEARRALARQLVGSGNWRQYARTWRIREASLNRRVGSGMRGIMDADAAEGVYLKKPR